MSIPGHRDVSVLCKARRSRRGQPYDNVCTIVAMATRAPRDQRWNLRVAESDDELVRAASASADSNFTDFVRQAAVAEANRVLADRTRFELDEESWQALNEMLDRPPRVPAGLRELFSKPSVFE